MSGMTGWDQVIVFKGLDNTDLATGLVEKLKEYVGKRPQVAHINYRHFADGELDDVFVDHEDISGKTIVFFECLKDIETVTRFLQLCWAAKKQYGARYIIAAISFMHYRRQDRPEKRDEIHRNQWIIEMMKNCGVDHVIVATPHSAQTEMNCHSHSVAFRAVDPSEAFASVLRPLLPEKSDNESAAVYAPDEGSIPRAIVLAHHLGISVLFNLKHRGFDNKTAMVDADQGMIDAIIAKYDHAQIAYATPELIHGVVIVMVEDEVDTGGTANDQARRLREFGAKDVYLCVTHAVCSNGWKRKLLNKAPFTKIIMCDTIPRSQEQRTGGQIHDVSMAGLTASAVYRVLQKQLFVSK